MNFDDALKHYAPRAWFRFKFLKYKYLKRGEPEIHLIRHLVAPGTTAIDIGCSIGIYAAEMARYANKVIAFEANPAVAQFARAVAPRNVEVVNVALSSAPGRATLKIPRNPKGATIDELATIEPGNPLHGGDAATTEIEMKRLDDFAIANCSFIKIDVEGHEEAVLDGAHDADRVAASRADDRTRREPEQRCAGAARGSLRGARLLRAFSYQTASCVRSANSIRRVTRTQPT